MLFRSVRDSKLLGFPVMVILSDKSNSVAEFVNANFVDYESKPAVASYLQFVIPRDKASLKENEADFLKEHKWQPAVTRGVTTFAKCCWLREVLSRMRKLRNS